jgi:FkbM family methyltransferase
MKHANLTIDAGAHIGKDTEFHLAKGFEVVAIEANPALAGELEKKFASEVAGGRLRILTVAIAETTGCVRWLSPTTWRSGARCLPRW